jgi:hypothetical protein
MAEAQASTRVADRIRLIDLCMNILLFLVG